jgi:O-antigen/teichoic acid export membrane protein
MSKAADMAKVSVRGGFHGMWGLVVSTVISSVGTIITASLLGEDNYGLYAIALTAPNLIVLFRDWGVNFAMVRYTAQSKAEDRNAVIRSIFMSGLLFELAMGVVLSLVGFLLSGFLASSIVNRPTIAPLIQIASFIVLASALISTATAAFTGVERMHFNSIMLVSQSIIKTTFIVGLVLLGLGTFGAIIGFTFATFMAGLIGILLVFTIYKQLPNPDGKKLEIGSNIRTMSRYGLPLSIAAIIAGFMAQFYNFILYGYVSNDAVIGNYAIAQNFVVLITFFALPITTMLFPAFSKLDHNREKETLQSVFQISVKYASLLVVPFAAMIMVLAPSAISTLFANRYAEAPLFLSLLAINYLYAALGNLSLGNLINGQGQTTFNLKVTVVTALIGFPLGFFLISNLGVLGLILTTIFVNVPGIVISLVFAKRRYSVTLDWRSSGKILLSSGGAAILTYAVIMRLNVLPSLIQLIIGVVIFALTYLIAAILTGTFNSADINNLRQMVTALGPLSTILNVLLSVIEKLMSIFKLGRKTPANENSSH